MTNNNEQRNDKRNDERNKTILGFLKNRRMTFSECQTKNRRLGDDGYSLMELMVVVAIMTVLTTASSGIYKGYIDKAKSSLMLNTGYQIKEALLICEAEYMATADSDDSLYWNDAFLKAPNHEDSILYPYVGEVTKDCTDYTLKIGKDSNGNEQIKGFVYETDDYIIRWTRGNEIEITKQ